MGHRDMHVYVLLVHIIIIGLDAYHGYIYHGYGHADMLRWGELGWVIDLNLCSLTFTCYR